MTKQVTIEDSPPHPNTVKTVIGALGLFSAYLFFIGWVYLTSYFYTFGLTTSSIEIPFHVSIGYAYGVMLEPLPMILLVIATIYFLLRVTDKGRSDSKGSRWWLGQIIDIRALMPIADLVMLAVLLPLLFFSSDQVAHRDAVNRQLPENTDLPNVDLIGAELEKISPDGACSLRLLYYGNNNFYVFCPKTGPDSVEVLIIPNGRVKAARIWRTLSETKRTILDTS